MFNFLPAKLIGFLSLTLYTLNTIFWLLPILVFSLLKALIPIKRSQKIFSYLLDLMATSWVAMNTLNQKLFTQFEIQITGLEALNRKDWYLVLANHQSWVDIVVLQRALHGQIPFLKFFLKMELIYIPILGLAWWALDFPFMKRYSQSFLKNNPHLKGKDLDTTRKACAKFKHKPVSVMSFIEGTRYTQAKYDKQNSPFNHLLKPKAGGIAFVLDAMGENLNTIVDITIHYPNGIPTFVDFLYGRVKTVYMEVHTTEITKELTGDYFNDRNFKIYFQKWLTQFWHDKDVRLDRMIQKSTDKES
ncbi:MAG TPA: acyltransferase [Colwellia sp.]|nr:acyltransferase [Colwellia sp.]